MQIYITDKSGKKFWNTNVSYCYSRGELNNMKRRLDCIQRSAHGYEQFDRDSARIVQDFDKNELLEMDNDERLLAELEA